MRPRLLLTGFGLWGDLAVNSSWAMLHDPAPDGGDSAEVITGQLPVSWQQAPRSLDELVTAHQPDAVVCFGRCPSPHLRLEYLAVNWACAERDADDVVFAGEAGGPLRRLDPGGPPALMSGLPLEALAAALTAADLEATVSPSAGQFLCNAVFYHLMRQVAAGAAPRMAGFIHVPPLRTEADNGWPVAHLREAVDVAVATVAGAVSAQKALAPITPPV